MTLESTTRIRSLFRGQRGTLVISLDTELAWGYYDDDHRREQLFSPDGSRERRSIQQMLALLEGHGIRATWGLVGHLFFSRCEDCQPCPVAAWRDDNHGYSQVHTPGHPGHPLWYAPDIRDQLLAAANKGQEIGFHGFSHRPFHQMDAQDAQREIEAWVQAAARFGIRPGSIIFPRGRAAHLEAFSAAGFRCFRAPDRTPRWHLRRFGPALKCADDLLALSTPRVFSQDQLRREQGLIKLPSSAHLFDFPRGIEQKLDQLGLQRLRLRGITDAIQRAAATGTIVHLWAHPWELRTPADHDKLQHVCEVAAEQINAGRLCSVTMGELAGTAGIQTLGRQAA